ncbi:MAG: hypothetical protein OEM23_07315, partial [Gemmatimonadota bacterium]|nr:hypothetical protein [Gemmatimonadota bacterium]
MDIAVNLVENYLRLNGYLTLSEFEVQQRNKRGAWETVTDIDIVAIRFPGPLFAGDAHRDDDCRFLLIEDDGLLLEDGRIDVIIGEVKQGEAVFNPGLKSHAALHTILQRFQSLYESALGDVIHDLQIGGVSHADASGGGSIRTRLVAFGRSPGLDANTISLSHMIETVYGYMRRNGEMLQGAQFKEPAPALL